MSSCALLNYGVKIWAGRDADVGVRNSAVEDAPRTESYLAGCC